MLEAESLIKYPAAFLLALVTTWGLTPWVRRIALRAGWVDQPTGRRVHQGVVPRVGGLALFAGFHLGGALIFLVPWQPFAGSVDLSMWKRLVLSSTLIMLLGFWDDLKELRPVWKLVGQVVVSSLAVAMGIRMGNLVGGDMPAWLDWILSIGWFLLMINAFNLIDGMDGLAAGLALVAACGLAASLFLRHAPGDVLLFLCLAGACLGFLVFNFHPASIFLGDCGSMFLGFILAALSLTTQSKGPAMVVLGVPLLAMGIPLLDTLLAIWRRSVRPAAEGGGNAGRLAALASADLDHLHHRLIRQGLNQRKAALLLYAGAILLSFAGVLLVVHRSVAQGILLLAFVGLFYVVFRHVALSELRLSGRVVLQGLERPTTKNSSVMFYAMTDTLFLLGSLGASVFLLDRYIPMVEPVRNLFVKLVPPLWGIPMIALVLAGSYTRVWSLARVSEFVVVGFALVGGILAGVGELYLTGASFSFPVLLLGVLHAGLSVPVIVGSRALVRVVQDFIALTHRIGSSSREGGRKVLLVGPSAQAAMALRLFSLAPPPGFEQCVAVGILDEDPVFQHRKVHGVRVLGSLSDLSGILLSTKVDTLLLVGQDDPAVTNQVRKILGVSPLPVLRLSITVGEGIPPA